MDISILTFCSKVASSLALLAKDSPLNDMSKNEYNMALYILKDANEEKNIRDALNRALSHLESAFANFRIKTWDIWDADRVLWEKRTFANSICLHIAILHYILDNETIAKKWLFNLDVMGSVYFPNELLKTLSLNNETDFYRLVAGADFSHLEDIIQQSEHNWEIAFDYDDDDPGPFLRGGAYSG